MSFSDITYKLSIWSIVLPLIIGIVFFRKLHAESRIIFYIVLAATFPQLVTNFIPQGTLLNVIYNIYTPLEFVLTYYFIGTRIVRFKKFSYTIVFVYSVFSLVTGVHFGINARFLNEWVCASNISYICWIFLYILESVSEDKTLLDSRIPMFWYLLALLLYTPCTILVFSFYYYIDKSLNSFIQNLWVIHDIFNTVLYLFFTLGFIVDRTMYRVNKFKGVN